MSMRVMCDVWCDVPMRVCVCGMACCLCGDDVMWCVNEWMNEWMMSSMYVCVCVWCNDAYTMMMWCDVMWCDVMWCDVTLRMRLRVMCMSMCDVMMCAIVYVWCDCVCDNDWHCVCDCDNDCVCDVRYDIACVCVYRIAYVCCVRACACMRVCMSLLMTLRVCMSLRVVVLCHYDLCACVCVW